MSAYAILGATGNVGLSILQILDPQPAPQSQSQSQPDIHLLVRSHSKLSSLHPLSNPRIKIFQGSISSPQTLTACLKNTKAVFLTVAITTNAPNCSIALDTARAVVSVLQTLKAEDPNFKSPRLIILSSASIDKKFWQGAPPFLHGVMWAANSQIYTDLAKAEAYLREHEDWLSSTFVMPGGLTHDVRQGHELSAERQQTFISFLDLAAGMVEIAEEGEKWDGKHVSVVLKGDRKARVEWWTPVVLAKGLLSHFFPWMYAYLP